MVIRDFPYFDKMTVVRNDDSPVVDDKNRFGQCLIDRFYERVLQFGIVRHEHHV